ncbi:thioesterase [Mycobacterium sp. M1]|uniref:Thioesterase TesA n=1 Tax=Mycolicibacter acidiphilus TaxID=2835306 RepID=A0ABS5RN30_9MYCO|nr:alpha/beta fold hydrolase [Mycolicibacter acidiphilus]MBS9534334.1 thioesterase [Mycolicibacter acidiphilus]
MTGPSAAADGFPSWIGRFADTSPTAVPTLVFPHAGGAAVNYRPFALALTAAGANAYVMQYPHRADRYREPAAETLPDLAASLFDAAPWHTLGPLRLFGHSMGSVVAFEFARLAEARGVEIQRLWASAGPAPATVAGLRKPSTTDAALRAELTELGGTDPRILADEEFLAMLLQPVRADYLAFNRYQCAPGVTIGAPISVLGGRTDDRIRPDLLQGWTDHTTGDCTVTMYDGGHFYHYEHIETLAGRVVADS